MNDYTLAMSRIKKNICRSDLHVTLSFTVILDGYRSFIPNKTTFTEYCLTQWISKLLVNFEIHLVRQDLEHFMDLVGIVNATVYKIEPIWTVSGLANHPNH